ncbi:hypothetical protein [uncultured Aquimarina sp.]|uniref:hypothetical protein n=1 Tax=uncultured Aquimarina sp. TaxID=575652 RepID=UPI00262E7224|nr:hypothetical protein [uncultured Aquimarina sp.]
METIDDLILNEFEKIKPRFKLKSGRINNLRNVLAYLRSGNGYVSVSSPMSCEFCDKDTLRLYYTDGEWIWGDWLIHYIENHPVGLPTIFLDRIKDFNFKCPVLTSDQIEKMIEGRN